MSIASNRMNNEIALRKYYDRRACARDASANYCQKEHLRNAPGSREQLILKHLTIFPFFFLQKNKSYRIALAAVDKYTINTYYVWHPIWNGMRLASNVKNVDNFWTIDVRALCAMEKLIANVIMLGEYILRYHLLLLQYNLRVEVLVMADGDGDGRCVCTQLILSPHVNCNVK